MRIKYSFRKQHSVSLTVFCADIFDWIAVPQLFVFAAVAEQRKHDVANNYLQSVTRERMRSNQWFLRVTLAAAQKFYIHTHTHTHLMALFPGLPGWADTRKKKPIWILLKQETVSGSGISWAICKSAPRSRQITTPAAHHSVFYRPDALPATQPTVSKHWRLEILHMSTSQSRWQTGN